MQRHALSSLILALAISLPAHASHHHHHAKAKLALTQPAAPAPAPTFVASRPTSSTKGARLVANSLFPGAVVAAPKKMAPKPVIAPAAAAATASLAAPAPTCRLARLTAYWTTEDPWTAQHESSTGIRLHEGHCAVDPKLIPYGSLIQIPGMGSYVAVDTGSAVISRKAALGSAQNQDERNALVVDLFFENRKEAEDFAAHGPSYAPINWTPRSLAEAESWDPRGLPAVPTIPPGTVYVLAQAPSLADVRMPLAFRTPQL
jgi:3D (Asp-Asp-Asp) domain-containing protein